MANSSGMEAAQVRGVRPTGGGGACEQDAFAHAIVSRCIGGVTHDANNLLGAILAHAELLAMNACPETHDRSVDEIITAVQRCSGLFTLLRDTVRMHGGEVTELSIGRLASDMMTLYQHQLRLRRIEWALHVEGEDIFLRADRSRLAMALICLIDNAMTALEREPENGRRLTLTIEGDDGGCAITVHGVGPMAERTQRSAFEALSAETDGFRAAGALRMAQETARLHGGGLEYAAGTGLIMRLSGLCEVDTDSEGDSLISRIINAASSEQYDPAL